MTTAREKNLAKKATTRSSAAKVLSKRRKNCTTTKVIPVGRVNKKKVTKIGQKKTITKKKLGTGAKKQPKDDKKKESKTKKGVLEAEVVSIVKGISKKDEIFIAQASVNTPRYVKHQNGAINRFYDFASCYKDGIPFGSVDFDDLFDHPPTKEKRDLFNSIMCPFMMLMKKVGDKKKASRISRKNPKNPYYQPSTQNTYLRTLFSSIKDHHTCFSFKINDFAYTGGFVSVITQLYQERFKKIKVS